MSIKVFAYGNIGKDAEKVTIGGKPFLKFPFAVSLGKDKDGNKKTLWVNICTSNENLERFLKKGQSLNIWGRPDPKVYKSQDGEAKLDYTIWANEISLTGSRPQDQQQPNNSSPVDDNTDLPF
jgi:single-stranded DNA-binding protein